MPYPHWSAEPSSRPENGRHVHHGARFSFALPREAFAVLLLVLALMLALPAGAVELEEVTTAAGAGASDLALGLLDRGQPAPTDDVAAWMRWEHERVRILSAKKEWTRLAGRLKQLPKGVSAEFRRWASGERAEALLSAGEAAAARTELAGLIWGDPPPTADQLAHWRRLVIRTYLLDGARDDAYTAMVRYRQDYRDADGAGVLLRARVLLSSGLARDAARLLGGAKGAEAQALGLLARLRAGQDTPKAVTDAGRRLARRDGLSLREQQLVWAVAAEAAQTATDYATEVIAREHLLAHSREVSLDKRLFPISADALWQAYVNYAQVVGNREQLLLGNDAAWFAAAKAAGRRLPVKVRSIYALLGLRAYDGADRERAHGMLVESLMGEKAGIEVVRQLYLRAPAHFAEPTQAPVAACRVLIDQAIADGNLALASKLQAGLSEPPEGTNRVVWRLRRAKIFILGGEPERGAQALLTLLGDTPVLTSDQSDRLVQVIFDLQTVGEDRLAISVLERLLGRVGNGQRRRELLYWTADSYLAQKNYREAARLYLRSATLLDPTAMDPWAQTARYQAAKALGQAGLVDDARGLFDGLLAVTKDPARRAVLRRDRQQLRLKHATEQ